MAKSVIEDISVHIKRLACLRPLKYKANITTNGYFLDIATARRLTALGIAFFQVSLDGPPDVHNRSRVRADGSGTFARIWSNLLALKKSTLDIEVVLRVHFSPDTHDSLDPLIDAINQEFADDNRFFVFFKAVERLGGVNDPVLRTFDPEQKHEVKRHLIEKLSRQSQVYSIAAADQSYICYASKPNSLVIRANGDVAKCTVAFHDDRNRIGKLAPNGEVVIDQDKLRWWIRGFASLKEEELSCPHGASRPHIVQLTQLSAI
jgi:uncharacterized protein